MREACQLDKAISSHTFILYPLACRTEGAGRRKKNNMKKLFSMMLVMASMVFVFSSCSEDEDKKSKFNYPMETLYGTWEATHIKIDADDSWTSLSWMGSKYQFSATFYSDGRYYGRGYFGTGWGTYKASGNTITTFVDGNEYFLYNVISLSSNEAHVTMGPRGGESIEVKLKKQ
jgi:hypothetical protein